jgi:outer membrane protein assembly factor BamE (lipoprotein component of BamABCDE complex)
MRRLFVTVKILLLVNATLIAGSIVDHGLRSLAMPMATAQDHRVQAQAGQTAESARPGEATKVTRGMKKEQVRTLWGEPVEVRQIRTCFGTREEWVYRGDPQRFGSEARTLLFDEDEVLDEMK